MAEYIVHSAQIQRSFEFEERKNLIERMPMQMREEFLFQNANFIFKSLPFFNLLENQTKI